MPCSSKDGVSEVDKKPTDAAAAEAPKTEEAKAEEAPAAEAPAAEAAAAGEGEWRIVNILWCLVHSVFRLRNERSSYTDTLTFSIIAIN